MKPPPIGEYTCVELEATVNRGSERLGMELNAYNQILSFQSGGPTDRHPGVQLYDRVVGVDGVMLESRMLTDVLVPAASHTFILERWAPPTALEASRRLSPRTLLSLGKARSGGAAIEESVTVAEKDYATRHSKKGRKHASSSEVSVPTTSRFTVMLTRTEPTSGLGLVCDEDNVVVDMVPGSPADLQRELETSGDPRLQVGDKIMTVDGVAISREQPLSAVIQPAEVHALSIERTISAEKAMKASVPPTSPMSPRGLLKAITPRSSKANKDATPEKGKGLATAAPMTPSRALREVRIYKAHEDERLGIRFVRDDDDFDKEMWGRDDGAVTPIVAALDPKGEAARAGMEIDDMVLSINGQTGLSNTEAAAMLRELSGQIVVVVRKCNWLGGGSGGGGGQTQEKEESMPTPLTPRSAMRRLI